MVHVRIVELTHAAIERRYVYFCAAAVDENSNTSATPDITRLSFFLIFFLLFVNAARMERAASFASIGSLKSIAIVA